jgi:uncharacterized protein YceK
MTSGRRSRNRSAWACLSAACLAAGCGTVKALSYGDYTVYAGAATDIEYVVNFPWILPFALVDLPLSFTADTLLLPYAFATSESVQSAAKGTMDPSGRRAREEQADAEWRSEAPPAVVGSIARTEASDVVALAVSPDGERLAATGAFGVVVGPIGTKAASEWRASGGASSLAWSADGRRLAVATSAGDARIFEGREGALEEQIAGVGGSVAFTPKGMLVGVVEDLSVRAWDPTSRTVRVVAPAMLASATSVASVRLAVAPDGRRAAVLAVTKDPEERFGYDESLEFLVDLEAGGVVWMSRHAPSERSCKDTDVAFSRDGARVAFADGKVTFRDTKKPESSATETSYLHAGRLAFAPGTDLWVAGLRDEPLVLVEPAGRRSALRVFIEARFILEIPPEARRDVTPGEAHLAVQAVALAPGGRRVFATFGHHVIAWTLPG